MRTTTGLVLFLLGSLGLLFGTVSCFTTAELSQAKKNAREIARMACMSQPMLETNLVAAHYTVTTTGSIERVEIVLDRRATRRRAAAAK